MKIKKIFTTGFISFILTLIILTFSFVIGVFKTEEGYTPIYFNSLFFKVEDLENGGSRLIFGFTENYLPILVTFLFILFFLLITINIYTNLKKRREELLNERKKVS
ncbi:MAG: hypothetical protein PT934_01490 [Peptoniphilaceae bacterium]|uniref:hypothetical protein n=1 Tax=Parvimonas sp. TaxID=1944660 RepID=UPI0025D3DB78|nr:hypothetical protein [Parvimonas sp.]MCI5997993.1 hypothetical protein [Parvimonas sp.]MDD7764421.1 hypothetical protein [Peptoniphilaceae bacterium]MDY3051369.1 hypothetical protein [Parvimonas sp.]